MVPINHLTDTVAILLRRDGAPQLWLDFGVVLTAIPSGFESRQIVNVTGTMQPGPSLHLSHLPCIPSDCSAHHVHLYHPHIP